MRILVYGCGEIGSTVLHQLQKNPDIRVITMDPREEPVALEKGYIDAIDIDLPLTPLVLDEIVETWEPDLILLATSSSDLALGNPPGVDILMESLWTELASMSDVPVLPVDRLAGNLHERS